MTLEELVQSAFDDVWERANGEVYVDCIFCDDDKHRLGINVETGVMHCFKCEEVSGDRSSTVKGKRKTYNKLAVALSVTDPFTLDEGEVDVTVEEKEAEIQKDKPKIEMKLPKAYEPLWRDVNDRLGKQARKYLKDRGVTSSQIKNHRIGFCGAGRYAYRIIFPIYYRRKLSGFVCRDFTGEAELKYLNSDGDKGIYNLPSKAKRRDKAILVEGIFDVLSVERAGLEAFDTLGGLGSKLADKLLEKLITYLTIIVWAEPDHAGVEGTIKRAKQLQKLGIEVLVVVPESDVESDTDPGAMSEEEIRQRVKDAVPFTSGTASLMRTRIAFSSKRFVKKKNNGHNNKTKILD